MSFDNSRFTFDPWKDYAGVVMEQGRVQTDADWNEWLAELSRRIRAGTLDILGHAVYPPTTPYAFKVETTASNGINIGLGRMYVDGILVENHGDPTKTSWDSALEELSNTPQPPPTTLLPLDATNSIPIGKQPYGSGIGAPSTGGDWLAYLDVWRRPVTYIEDSTLIDSAIGIDTTGRLQTAWQVRLMALPNSTIAGSVTSGTFQEGEQVIQSNTGASATLHNVPSATSGMIVGPITGSPDATDTWVGQTSGAVFTPTATPLGDYSTIAGAVTGGTFVLGEQVVQSNTAAAANIVAPVTASGPLLVDEIVGTADATDTWIGQTSGAVFTPSAAPVPTTWSCATPDSDIPWPRSSALLSNHTQGGGDSGPCCLTSGTGYTGAENQFYRVEIHQGGTAGGADATFKWSRENASVQTNVTGISQGHNTLGDPASVLTVQSLGRDQVLGFVPGNWIEITNQTMDDFCLAGELYKIDKVDPAGMTITLTSLLSPSFPPSSLNENTYTRIIRWDQSGTVYKADGSPYYDLDTLGSGGVLNGSTGIPIPQDGSHLLLENGIVVWFGLSVPTGRYQQMDFWNFSARAATGDIDPLTQAPPRGLHHHFTKLAVLSLGSGAGGQDCRTPWKPGSCDCGGGCCTVTVGDGTSSFGMYSSIQQAINALPDNGGEVCILPGTYYEYVLLEDLSDVVIHGCEYQSLVLSPQLGPGTNTSTSQSGATASGLTAIFTIVNCRNIDMRWLSIAAGTDEVGILLDRAAPADNTASSKAAANSPGILYRTSLNSSINLEHLVVVSSTLPALVARGVSQFKVDESSFRMRSVASRYPVVFMAGSTIFFERNQVIVFSNDTVFRQNPQTGATGTNVALEIDLALTSSAGLTAAEWAGMSPGGVQIAGPSNGVFLTENTIQGGNGNGITLGDFLELDTNGNATDLINGVRYQVETNCTTGGSGALPSPPSTGGGGGGQLVAGGIIRNLHIDRNIIRNVGMSGIGPVGFFDLAKNAEIITLINVSIRSNVIAHTLLRPLENNTLAAAGYGAIGMPDVQNLTIRDNSIIDFGQNPGDDVCGIYILNGEGIEISRNHIRETRDLAGADLSTTATGSQRAGILIHLAAPVTFNNADALNAGDTAASAQDVSGAIYTRYEAPVYVPGMPALRIQENEVRVAEGLALQVRGTGPFSIVNNHFSSGSPSRGGNYQALEAADLQTVAGATSFTSAPALLVYILNLGISMELEDVLSTFSGAYTGALDSSFASAAVSRTTTNGTVLFSNNICQLEARARRIRGATSVLILTLDNLVFSSNQLWVDGLYLTAFVDAFLFAITLEANTNRFQESLFYPVIFSAFAFAIANITTNNIATYCIEAGGLRKVIAPNLVLVPDLCRDQK